MHQWCPGLSQAGTPDMGITNSYGDTSRKKGAAVHLLFSLNFQRQDVLNLSDMLTGLRCGWVVTAGGTRSHAQPLCHAWCWCSCLPSRVSIAARSSQEPNPLRSREVWLSSLQLDCVTFNRKPSLAL